MAGWWRAVGWNCTNSRSATAIPAQGHGDAVAGGLGWVRRHREQLAGSPVATSTWWAALGPFPRRSQCHHPAAAAAIDEQVQREPVLVDRGGRWWTAATKARSTSTPVAAPPACTRVRASARPRANSSSPRESRSKMAPRAISSLTRADPRRPAPARRPDRTARPRPPTCRPGADRSSRGHRTGPPPLPLGPAGRRLVQLRLGEHADLHAMGLCRPHRGRQPGHPRSEDQQVEHAVHSLIAPVPRCASAPQEAVSWRAARRWSRRSGGWRCRRARPPARGAPVRSPRNRRRR